MGVSGRTKHAPSSSANASVASSALRTRYSVADEFACYFLTLYILKATSAALPAVVAGVVAS